MRFTRVVPLLSGQSRNSTKPRSWQSLNIHSASLADIYHPLSDCLACNRGPEGCRFHLSSRSGCWALIDCGGGLLERLAQLSDWLGLPEHPLPPRPQSILRLSSFFVLPSFICHDSNHLRGHRRVRRSNSIRWISIHAQDCVWVEAIWGPPVPEGLQVR